MTRIGDSDPEPLPPGVEDPLAGVRALGMGHVIAGAGVGRALALHGADVLTQWRPDELEHDVTYVTADVFYADRRPGMLDRVGLSAPEAADVRPGIVHATASLNGPTGPWADRLGFDQTAGSLVGMMHLEGDGTRPALPPIVVVDDDVVSWLLTAGVVEALARRAVGGGSWPLHVSRRCWPLAWTCPGSDVCIQSPEGCESSCHGRGAPLPCTHFATGEVRVTSSDRVVAAVRADILSGRHAPGARLGEVDLARELGTSRTPVREALRRLVAEGLVELSANRGARVVAPSPADLEAVFVLRARSEGLAARTAAAVATGDDLRELDRLARAIAAAARPHDGAAPDLDAVYRDNRAFHDLLLGLARSPTLTAVVAGLVHSTILMRTYRAFDDDAMQRSVEHHLELVAALRARDPDWAESVMHSHLYSARAALLGPRQAAPPTPVPTPVPTRDLPAEESA